MKYFFFIICTVFFVAGSYSQNGEDSVYIATSPVKIVAHTDSSIFLLTKKRKHSDRQWDFYISKHTAYKKSVDFDTCLAFGSLFNGKFNPDIFNYSALQCNNNLVILFDAVISGKKTLLGKIIDFNGKVSGAFKIDETNLNDPNMSDCKYLYSLTSKKDILVTVRRTYRSGYQRDKCLLLNSRLIKIWEYELPKINALKEVNVVAYAYGTDQLIYYTMDGTNMAGHQWSINSHPADTIIKRAVAGLKYDLKVRKDSLQLLFVTPSKQESKVVKIYWPYQNLPVVTSLSASHVLLYNLVDIDDEKFVLPAKKAIYYKRVDIKNNKVLYDSLMPLNNHIQNSLTYLSMAQTDRPTSKPFMLISEKLVDGKVVSLFRHAIYEDSELMVSSFDIVNNEFNWVNFIPRKLSTKKENLDVFVFNYANRTLNLGFYENKENFAMPIEQYRHRKYIPARTFAGSNFISVSILADGTMKKQIADETTEEFLFPWFAGDGIANTHFFESYRLLPVGFLYKTP